MNAVTLHLRVLTDGMCLNSGTFLGLIWLSGEIALRSHNANKSVVLSLTRACHTCDRREPEDLMMTSEKGEPGECHHLSAWTKKSIATSTQEISLSVMLLPGFVVIQKSTDNTYDFRITWSICRGYAVSRTETSREGGMVGNQREPILKWSVWILPRAKGTFSILDLWGITLNMVLPRKYSRRRVLQTLAVLSLLLLKGYGPQGRNRNSLVIKLFTARSQPDPPPLPTMPMLERK